jgi:hypothetical protein
MEHTKCHLNALQRRFLSFVWRSIQSRQVKVAQSDASKLVNFSQFYGARADVELVHANQALNLNRILNDSVAVKEGAA